MHEEPQKLAHPATESCIAFRLVQAGFIPTYLCVSLTYPRYLFNIIRRLGDRAAQDMAPPERRIFMNRTLHRSFSSHRAFENPLDEVSCPAGKSKIDLRTTACLKDA